MLAWFIHNLVSNWSYGKSNRGFLQKQDFDKVQKNSKLWSPWLNFISLSHSVCVIVNYVPQQGDGHHAINALFLASLSCGKYRVKKAHHCNICLRLHTVTGFEKQKNLMPRLWQGLSCVFDLPVHPANWYNWHIALPSPILSHNATVCTTLYDMGSHLGTDPFPAVPAFYCPFDNHILREIGIHLSHSIERQAYTNEADELIQERSA